MTYLFLDTSVLLHYQSFEDIPWSTLLGLHDDVTIVICETVISEVDKHKDSQRSKLRDRAKKMSKLLSSLFLEGQTGKIPVVTVPFVSPSGQESVQYDISVSDNRILLSALNCPYSSSDIVMVSADNNLLIKSKQEGLRYFKMEDNYRLSEEPTEEEKELKKVKQQLAVYQNRQSAPALYFPRQTGSVLKLECPSEPDIEVQSLLLLEGEACRYPEERGDEEVTFDNCYSVGIAQMMQQMQRSWNVKTPEQRKCYNQMRKEYLEAYRQKQELLLRKKYEHACFYPLSFELKNTGTAQTGDMLIQIDFPADIPLYTEEESMTTYTHPRLVTPQYHRPFPSIPSLYTGKADNEIDILDKEKPVAERQYKCQQTGLIHGLSMTLETGYYVDLRQFTKMDIRWTIADASLLHHVQGVLTLETAPTDSN